MVTTNMFDPNLAGEYAKKFIDSLPDGLKGLHQDLEAHFKQFFIDSFAKMSLVTQEEYETQTKVLAKTREKLEKLEQRLTELEKLCTKP